MKRIYHTGDTPVYKNIHQDSPVGLVFCSGLGSPIRQQKEAFFRRFALTRGISYLALDYTHYALGFKRSDNFGLATIPDKTIEILNDFPAQKLLLFGACFGGLMGLKVAQAMPDRVAGAVVTSPPFEMSDMPWTRQADAFLHRRTEESRWRKNLSFNQLRRLGILHLLFISTIKTHCHSPVTTAYQGPLTVFHGEKDPLIPARNSLLIQQKMQNPNMQVQIVPNMKHTVSMGKDMQVPLAILEQYLDQALSRQG